MLGRLLTCSFTLAVTLTAQPYINYRGVVNGASFAPQGNSNGSIARGSIFTIFGRQLGPEQFVQPSQFPLDTVLGGVSVTVTQGETVLDAIPIFVWNTQVSAVMPSNAPLGRVVVRLTFNGQTSNPAIVNVVESSVGIFALNSGGYGPGIVQNVRGELDRPINTTRVTARPGDVLIAWGTGLSAAAHPDNAVPEQIDFPIDVEIFVGGKPALRRYAGRSSCCAGLDQFVFDVPLDAPEGCYVPVQVRSAGSVVSNAVTIAIQRDGDPCTDAFNPMANAFRAGGSIGLALLRRYLSNFEPYGGAPTEVTEDRLYMALKDEPGGDTYFNPLLSLPPVGACTTYGAQAAPRGPGWIEFLAGMNQLDGGAAAQLTGPLGVAEAPREAVSPNIYRAVLGKDPTLPDNTAPFLSPGAAFSLSLPGGVDVGAAAADFVMTPPLNWTNQAQSGLLDRSAAHTVNWTGGNTDTDVVLIAAEARNTPANSASILVCVAPVAAGAFTIPQYATSTLPVTPGARFPIPGEFYLGAADFRDPVDWTPPGLDAAFVTSSTFRVQPLGVQE